jgi:hypothetical protein
VSGLSTSNSDGPGELPTNDELPTLRETISPSEAPASTAVMDAPHVPGAPPAVRSPLPPIPGTRTGTRLPIAFLGAIAILIVVEIVVRALPMNLAVPYLRGETAREAVLAYIDRYGSADVAFVGSSQMREAASPPRIEKRLKERGGPTLSVGNYGVRGARLDEMNAIIQRLLASKRKPQLVVIGVAPRDFRQAEPNWVALGQYWHVGDWWHARRAAHTREEKRVIRKQFWTAVDNTIADHWLTLRYRDRVVELIREPREYAIQPPAKNPVTGDPGKTRDSLLGGPNPLSVSQIRNLFRQDFVKGNRYPINEAMGDELADAIDRCRAAGVKVVVLEMPLPEVTKEALDKPSGAYKRFANYTEQIANEHGATFLSSKAIRFTPDVKLFIDTQHANAAGSQLFSRCVADYIIVPQLVGSPGESPATEPATAPAQSTPPPAAEASN